MSSFGTHSTTEASANLAESILGKAAKKWSTSCTKGLAGRARGALIHAQQFEAGLEKKQASIPPKNQLMCDSIVSRLDHKPALLPLFQVLDISVLATMPSLRHLDVSHNLLCRMEPIEGRDLPPRLETLNMGHNRISRIGGIGHCFLLRVIDLRNNRIKVGRCFGSSMTSFLVGVSRWSRSVLCCTALCGGRRSKDDEISPCQGSCSTCSSCALIYRHGAHGSQNKKITIRRCSDTLRVILLKS